MTKIERLGLWLLVVLGLIGMISGIVNLTARAQELTCTVSPLSVSFPHVGGAADFTVTGDRAWVAIPVQPWITVPMSTDGDGPGMFTILIPPNTGPARRGTIRVGDQVVTVSQKKAPGKR